MNKIIHQHPIAIFRYIGKYIFLLIFPLIRGFFIAISGGFTAWLQSAWLDILTITALLIFATLKWSCYVLEDLGNYIKVKSGVFYTREYKVDKSNITTLCSIDNFLFRPVKAVKLKLDTAAGNPKASDVIVTLSLKSAESIMKSQKVFLGKETYNLRYRPRNMALVALSAISSNSFAGVLLIATFVFQSGQILGQEFSDKIYYSLEEFAAKIAYGIPPLAMAFAVLIISGWILAFISNFLRHYHFTVGLDESAIEISGGIVTKRTYLLPRHHINFIDIRETLFTKMFNVSSVFVDVIGYGKAKDDMSAILPLTSSYRIENELKISIPEFHLSKPTLRPTKDSLLKFIFYPTIFLSCIPLFVHILRLEFPDFYDSIGWLGIMTAIPLVWLIIVRILDLATSGISLEQNCYTLRYSKGFSFHSVVIPKDKITGIRLRTSILQRISNKCDLFITSLSEESKVHCIKNLKRNDVCNMFNIT